MSHDVEASYAAMELVNHLLQAPTSCFSSPPPPSSLSGYAAKEGRYEWPHADGVIELAVSSGGKPAEYSIAMEFKRPNEGLHGVLTAIGQSHAYLRKGYSGAVMVIPDSYTGFKEIGNYVREVIDLTSSATSIGVVTYSRPDMSKVSPFAGKLTVHRPFIVDKTPPISTPRPPSRSETQWAHVREGSTDPDAFFKYLQAVKLIGGGMEPHVPFIPLSLSQAVKNIRPGAESFEYLANCAGNTLPDNAWRHFWFKYVLHDDALMGWTKTAEGAYLVNREPLKILKSDGTGRKLFFAARSDSIKVKLVDALNKGAISEEEASEALVQNYFKRAHSYREDIDSGCEHLGFVDRDGRLTDLGFRFVDVCERFGNPNDGVPRAVFLNALLSEGSLSAFLHYIHRLSEERFNKEPLAFTTINPDPKSKPSFDHEAYLNWLEVEMKNNLHVIRKVSLRGGTQRKPFQAELAVLRSLGVVGDGYRTGTGLVIKWPEIQESLSLSLSSHLVN